jgi:flagellin
MTSILTNVSAMAAIQTLRSINTNMETTQARVSSGLRVGTASDNAAYWSIATTMRSDNMALEAVQDALGLGAAKVDTAYSAMESVVDVVEEIKKKMAAATEDGVDKSKIQEELKQLQDQLKSISQSASFSGENWLTQDLSNGPVTKSVVGSFIRSSDGTVKVQKINYELDSTTVLFDTGKGAVKQGLLDTTAKIEGKRSTVEITTAVPVTETGDTLVKGGATITVNATTGAEEYKTSGGDIYIRQFDASKTQLRDENGKDKWVKVTATAGTSPNDKAAYDSNGAAYTDYFVVTAPVVTKYNVASTTDAALTKLAADNPNITVGKANGVATITTNPGAVVETYVKLGAADAWVKATIGPGTPADDEYNADGVKGFLYGADYYFIDEDNSKAPGDVETDFKVSISDLDITKLADLAQKTGFSEEEVLDHLFQFVSDTFEDITSASASLGSISMRIGMQEDFVSKLTDSIDKGVGRLVDADMNEESTRLKALQTQQQLAIQALSIANSTSENILSLFRQ